jgi:hypothetical protein
MLFAAQIVGIKNTACRFNTVSKDRLSWLAGPGIRRKAALEILNIISQSRILTAADITLDTLQRVWCS